MDREKWTPESTAQPSMSFDTFWHPKRIWLLLSYHPLMMPSSNMSWRQLDKQLFRSLVTWNYQDFLTPLETVEWKKMGYWYPSFTLCQQHKLESGTWHICFVKINWVNLGRNVHVPWQVILVLNCACVLNVTVRAGHITVVHKTVTMMLELFDSKLVVWCFYCDNPLPTLAVMCAYDSIRISSVLQKHNAD